jgi:hypothetical protein
VGLNLELASGAVDVELVGDTIPNLEDWIRAVEALGNGASLHLDATERASDQAVARLIGLVRAVDLAVGELVWRQAGARFGAGLAEAGIDPMLIGFPDRAQDTTLSAGSRRS